MIKLTLKDGSELNVLSYMEDSVGLHIRIADEMTVLKAAQTFSKASTAGHMVFDGDEHQATYDGYTEPVMISMQYQIGLGMQIVTRKGQ